MSQSQDTGSHRRRKPRKAPADPNLDGTAQTDDGVSTRQKANHKKRSPPQQHESALTQELQETGVVTTPPRSSHGRGANESDHPNNNGQKNIRKKKGQQGSTPGPKQQRHATPLKGHLEAAYAGPTFNSSSPAPANLPIPKMFSKSAPQADQEVGIKARMQQEENGQSSASDEAPDSPSMRPSTGRVSGGPSMFDYLINAHRQEKAGQKSQTLSPPQAGTRENSISPVHAQILHRPKHSRTLTDDQIFPLEPSSANMQQSPSPAHGRQPPSHQLGPAFNHSPQSSTNDDGNLKRILFSSPQQAPPSGYYGAPQGPSQWNSSPASQGSHSTYASPVSSATGLASSSRPAPASPYTQASPSPSARRTGYPPYNNSGLRREFSPEALNHTPPPLGNLPRYQGVSNGSPLASPTYQRFNHSNSPFGGQGFNSPDRNASPAGNKRFSAQDALKSLGGAPPMSEMEDRLRQILRIDSMSPAGSQSSNAAGAVRS